MRIFKTICHNNIHRDYTNELIKIEPKEGEPSILWKDQRPTFTGKLQVLVATREIGNFIFEELVVGQEYLLQINDDNRVYVIVDGVPCSVVFGERNKNRSVIGLGDGVIDSLDYFEFFYTESEMRDNKLKQIGI